jgi:ElaB/YqjD/DUF883 family membrane-anchored ribosome-binding protein
MVPLARRSDVSSMVSCYVFWPSFTQPNALFLATQFSPFIVKKIMYNLQRWIKILLLVLVLITMSAFAEEEVHHEAAEDEPAETEAYEEYVPEDTEVLEEPEVFEEIVNEVHSVIDAVEEKSESVLEKVKSKLSSVVDTVISKAKSLIERCKNMSKADIKKVAAAAVGIWGVAVGVGYLTKGAPPPPAKPVAATKKK